MSYCDDCIHKPVCYRTDSVSPSYADKCGDFASEVIGHWIMPVQDDGMSEPTCYQVRCSECGFDLDPQTWHMELHQYGADRYCPSCGAKMESEG